MCLIFFYGGFSCLRKGLFEVFGKLCRVTNDQRITSSRIKFYYLRMEENSHAGNQG